MMELFRLGRTFKILKSSCDPYSLCLGIFPCRIWLFQAACITEDGLFLTDKKRQGSWVAFFETTELLPWPWAALSSYQHRGLSLGYLKNLIMDSDFNGVVRIFCWLFILLLYVIYSHYSMSESTVHVCIGSITHRSVFIATQRCFSLLCWLSTNSSTTTPIQPTPFSSSFTSGAGDSGSTEG